MNSELRELYQEIIVDHSKRPRNFHKIAAGRAVEGFNPLCGDRLTVYVVVDDDKIVDVGFVGNGCAISTASASVMTEAIKGKSLAEAHAMFAQFHAMVTTGATPDPALGKLAVFGGVAEFPSRVKCATLPWHTLEAALEGNEDRISTE